MRVRYRRIRVGQSRRQIHLRKARCRWCQQISRPAQYLLTPCVEQPAADPILPRHLSRRKAWPQTFGHDVALLLPCPSPTRFAADKDLNRRATSAPMTYRTRTLSIGDRHRRWRHLVHARLRSCRRPVAQCAAPTALTPKVVRPAVRRDVVGVLQSAYQVSERRACQATGFHRSSQRYRSRRDPQTELRLRLRDLAASRVRYGYRRLHVLLRREGWPVNAKRIWRLYSEEGLSIRPRTPRRRRAWRYRIGRKMTTAAANDVWAMDFLSDALFDGRPFGSVRAGGGISQAAEVAIGSAG